MKNTETVKENLYKLFKQYREASIDETQFIKAVTNLCKSRGNKSYWWRFFKGDTGVTDAYNLTLSLNSITNRAYIIECIDTALESKGLTVYHS